MGQRAWGTNCINRLQTSASRSIPCCSQRRLVSLLLDCQQCWGQAWHHTNKNSTCRWFSRREFGGFLGINVHREALPSARWARSLLSGTVLEQTTLHPKYSFSCRRPAFALSLPQDVSWLLCRWFHIWIWMWSFNQPLPLSLPDALFNTAALSQDSDHDTLERRPQRWKHLVQSQTCQVWCGRPHHRVRGDAPWISEL
jgi:hypothetical protein